MGMPTVCNSYENKISHLSYSAEGDIQSRTSPRVWTYETACALGIEDSIDPNLPWSEYFGVVRAKVPAGVFNAKCTRRLVCPHSGDVLDCISPSASKTSGIFCFRRNCTQWACPYIVRLKHPSLSPANESAPHCSTTTGGR